MAETLFRDPGFVDGSSETQLVAELIRPLFTDNCERLVITAFDDRGRLIGLEQCTEYKARYVVMPMAMARQAISNPSTTRLVLAHNHPSDECRPSPRDLDMTQRFAAMCAMMGIVLDDHIIVVSAGHFSFKAAGLL